METEAPPMIGAGGWIRQRTRKTLATTEYRVLHEHRQPRPRVLLLYVTPREGQLSAVIQLFFLPQRKRDGRRGGGRHDDHTGVAPVYFFI